MQHTVKTPSAPFKAASGAFEIHQVPAWEDNLVWLFVCQRTGAAAVVDGPDAEAALTYAKQHGIEITHVLNTHTHLDHVGINQDLERRGLLAALTVYGPAKMAKEVPGLTRGVGEGDSIEVGACKARVMLTEGHIVGHVCFVFEDAVFSGDTLFAGGCGRVFTEDYVAMHDGLLRLSQLDPATRVCCAHEYTQDNLRFAYSVEPENDALAQRIRKVWALRGQGGCAVPSTIADELATNPFLRTDSEPLRQHVAQGMPEAVLDSPRAIFEATRRLKDKGTYRAAGDSALPL